MRRGGGGIGGSYGGGRHHYGGYGGGHGGGGGYGGGGGGDGGGGGGGGGGGYGGDHHGDYEDYHRRGEYGRLHLPVHSFLDHEGLGHNLRPMHALNELHGRRHHSYDDDIDEGDHQEEGHHDDEGGHVQEREFHLICFTLFTSLEEIRLNYIN